MVEQVGCYNERFDLSALLVWRDAIQRTLDSGEKLDTATADRLRQADDALVEQREMLTGRFPDLFDPAVKRTVPTSYWWWRLDEGIVEHEDAVRASMRR